MELPDYETLCLECHGPQSPNGPHAVSIEQHTHQGRLERQRVRRLPYAEDRNRAR